MAVEQARCAPTPRGGRRWQCVVHAPMLITPLPYPACPERQGKECSKWSVVVIKTVQHMRQDPACCVGGKTIRGNRRTKRDPCEGRGCNGNGA